MELLIRSRSENELELEIKGEDHTLLNLLKYYLNEDPRVEFASYRIEFPGITHPVLYLRVSSGNEPIQVLKQICSQIIQRCSEFEKQYRAALKNQAALMLEELAGLLG